jgi:heme oxygenase
MALRQATAAAHERVDARFGTYDLAARDDYARFLAEHARAVGAAEAYLARATPELPWRARMPLLRADLAALGQEAPAPAALDLPIDAALADGVVYVLEGSRLGGQLLVKQVGADLPDAYLAAAHLPGEWRALREAMDARAATDPDWVARATTGAEACFALF